ncbi:hypothetical protein ACSBR1_017015 [Camellia fascicularis]
MIKNIRAERAAAENKKTEAIERAKLLIAEAEKAAKALEAAATKSPLAQASLIETRNLIAKAIQSIEIGQIDSHGNGRHPSIALAELEELYQTSMSDYGLPPSELDGIIKQCSFTEQLSQLEFNGNGPKFQSRKEETPPNFVAGWLKWWMEIRLVYKNVVKLTEFSSVRR